MQYFRCLEEMVVGGGQGKNDERETHSLNLQIQKQLAKNTSLRHYLLSKIIVFSCFNEQSTLEYAKYFELMAKNGVFWISS